MKSPLLFCCFALMLAPTTQAAVYYSYPSGTINATIPDGNPVGWSTALNLSSADMLPVITGVTVNLNISGEYNGDLYAYLSYGGVLVPLLNRVGVQTGDAFGYGTAGMNVTLADGNPNIHWASSDPLTGTYAPDGREISPLSAPSAFDANGTIGFSDFHGLNPNGTWTIFFADLSSGETSTLNSWSLSITAEVPEPVNVALGIFAGVFALVALARNRRLRSVFRQALAH